MSGSLPGYRLLVFDVCSEHQDLLLEKWLPTTPKAAHYFPGSVTADEALKILKSLVSVRIK